MLSVAGEDRSGKPAEGLPELGAFVRGCRAGVGRLGEDVRPRLPADTWSAAAVPAGVVVELVSHAQALVLVLETAPRHPLAAPTTGDHVTVWQGERKVGQVEVPADGGPVTVPLRPDGAAYTLHLPEARLGRIVSLEPVRGRVEPVADRPRWLAYGDSITQGWSVSDPACAYPATVARRYGFEAWNLGFAGAARGEIAAAQYLATLEADVISLAFGTNNWSVLPTGPQHMAGLLRDFVAVVRSGHPRTPLVVISPLLRPEAEDRPNAVGATLADLRHAVEETVGELAREDRALRLLAGGELVGAGELVDGIHPGDAGHRRIADALGPVLAQMVEAGRAAAPDDGTTR
ncbi:SGNH/GDSL hydrolase family protein [Streptomyces gilvus]|uniref:SGNH/GDSL hydrolase family protein n=1 Tax=Streptomyces gilvus TaxID=2920937 RepID=UPI001F0E5CA2|nr:SGNH/GDSL hydrolase family protein [Streptomyces sp. CME 23]MCH5677566.1 GDSL-type esterase/lipase family protein [Streptomyces sp. CME 23]